MIDGLVGGTLYGTPQKRTAQSGNAFVTAKVRAAGSDGEPMFVNVIAFGEALQKRLMSMNEGDSIVLAGPLTPKVWTDRNGQARAALDMVAHAILSAYEVQRRRKAVHSSGPAASAGSAMDDDL